MFMLFVIDCWVSSLGSTLEFCLFGCLLTMVWCLFDSSVDG